MLWDVMGCQNCFNMPLTDITSLDVTMTARVGVIARQNLSTMNAVTG